jgi:hypothetical protein
MLVAVASGSISYGASGFFPDGAPENFEGRRTLQTLSAMTGGTHQEYDRNAHVSTCNVLLPYSLSQGTCCSFLATHWVPAVHSLQHVLSWKFVSSCTNVDFHLCSESIEKEKDLLTTISKQSQRQIRWSEDGRSRSSGGRGRRTCG